MQGGGATITDNEDSRSPNRIVSKGKVLVTNSTNDPHVNESINPMQEASRDMNNDMNTSMITEVNQSSIITRG